MKPLFRWTIGDTTLAGVDVLRASVSYALRVFGRDRFDWVVCSNAKENHHRVRQLSEKFGIGFHQATWDDFPLDVSTSSTDKRVHCHDTPGYDTFWKVCPPRMRLGAHEIIVDNDIIFQREPPEIEEFLNSRSTLMVKEVAEAHGKYFESFEEGETYNSGILGLPPDFDFGHNIRKAWKELGGFDALGCRDEQGLLTYVLKQCPHIDLSSDRVISLMTHGRAEFVEHEVLMEVGKQVKAVKKIEAMPYRFSGSEYAIHFQGVNRFTHHYWLKYLEMATISV